MPQMFFLFFIIVYLNGYYSVVSTKSEVKADEPLVIPDAMHIAKPSKKYLFTTLENNGNILPGAVLLDSNKFEIEVKKEKRNVNQLPGAIGIEGAFDDNKVSIFGEQSSTVESGNEKEKSKQEENKSNDENGRETIKSKTKGKKGNLKKNGVKTKSGDLKNSKTESESNAQSSSADDNKDQQKASKGEISKKSEDEGKSEKNAKSENKKSTKGNQKNKNSKNSKSKDNDDLADEPLQSPAPLYTGPHPMNRQMSELQVSGEDEELDDEAVRKYYKALVKAYLAPFVGGIQRKSFFKILKRRTYSLAPPGSNKGIQTLLFQLLDKSRSALQIILHIKGIYAITML